MVAIMQTEQDQNRFVRSRAFAALLVLAAFWSLILRIRHLSDRLRVPHNFVITPIWNGSMGRVMDLSIYLGMAALSICLFTETRDRLDRVLLAACFAPLVINPLKMLLPAYASMIGWLELACTMIFSLVSVAVFLRLCRSGSTTDLDRLS